MRLSDVYSFEGTDSEIFALPLSFDGTAARRLPRLAERGRMGKCEGRKLLQQPFYATQFEGAFAQFDVLNNHLTLSSYLGAWGTDVNNGVTSTWAVINHNSDFTIVPEPSTVALLLIGVGSTLLRLRRRKITL